MMKPRHSNVSRARSVPLLVFLALVAASLARPVWAQVKCPVPADPGRDGSPFLLKRTDARIVITGPVAHAVVTQSWENPNTVPVDGLYIFPLPENAAVTDMSLRIGERVVRGEMHRREEARALYDQARAAGRVAGLLDQERPNIFAQRVANIMPGVRVEVVLSFDHEIRCEEEGCEYVFPTVVGPRFIPSRQADPGAIDPPIIEKGRSTGQTLAITVDLEEGVSFRDLESPSHRVAITREGKNRARVTLDEEGATPLNRDFHLRWRVGGRVPEVGLLAWRDPALKDEPGVFTLVLQPPADPAADEATPRELIFVLDCSGSMSGEPIEAAKSVVRQALRAVRTQDTFQIIRFSDHASGLGPLPLSPSPENVRRGLAYLDSLQGEGGTEMISGIRAALGAPADPGRLRIVAFLTDGYIGNETEILAEVRRLLGAARLFSFGIGSSVNRYLLEGLAEEGRGAAAFLGLRETPDAMVERFVRRIDAPLLTDIRVEWEDVEVGDLEPALVPDLFAGQPLVIHGRYRHPGSGLVRVEARRRGAAETLRQVVNLPEQAADHEALGRLWARARIHSLSRRLHEGDRPEVREAITQIGLTYRLMTAYTSLVAVDSVVSNTTGSSRTMTVPVEMPEGVRYEGIFGEAAAPQMARSAAAPVGPPPVANLAAGLKSLGYLGGAGSFSGGAGHRDQAADEGVDPRKAELGLFTRLVLFRKDGAIIEVESDGDVWRTPPAGTRRLTRTLTPTERQALRQALAATDPKSWAGSESGPRLVLEAPGARRIVPLTAAGSAVGILVRLIEGFAI
ncbi:MAG TPA: VIT domain-containing protein [Candidatus Polarisedimenticolia bacterium]|nr:VIT domain-containing protein [Candidatus Polarisedimenticolia bacterium]